MTLTWILKVEFWKHNDKKKNTFSEKTRRNFILQIKPFEGTAVAYIG